jgi:hypothetical protein
MPVAPERLILRVLQETGRTIGREVTRTELVKLIYLVDCLYAQHRGGQTLTGLTYFWDNHGPNAVGNAIVKRADWMELTDQSVRSYEALTPTGNSKFLYKADDQVPYRALDDELGEAIVREVVQEYGDLGWKQLTDFAKQTRPMRGKTPGDLLDLAPPAAVGNILNLIQEKNGRGAYDDVEPGVPLAKLVKRYGLGAG